MDVKDNSWIKALYQRSWEMELLISGFALVFLLQSFENISRLFSWVDYVIPESQEFIHLTGIYIVSLLALSVTVLTLFLVLNLIFRAYWIALIGLVSRVKKHSGAHQFSAYRKQNIRQVKEMRSTFNHIDRVDKWGSQLFSVALLFLFMVASTVICFIWFLSFSLLHNSEVINNTLLNSASLIYFICTIFFVFDIFSGGIISRIKTKAINVPYFYVYLIFRYLSFYFLYEKIALNAKGNGQIKAINTTLFVLVISLFATKSIENTRDIFQSSQGVKNSTSIVSHKIRYLDEIKSKGYLTSIALNKSIYHHMPIKVFVPFTATIASYIKESCPAEEESIKLVETSCLNAVFKLFVNDQPIAVKWHADTHITTGTKGVTAYIDLPGLARGEHQFLVKASYLEAPLTKAFWYYPK